MFIWYHHSALTIVYLSDVPPSSKSDALAKSVWNKRGWTFQELMASRCILFYQKDWTPYFNDRSSNHKDSNEIIEELTGATGIDQESLVTFHPGTRNLWGEAEGPWRLLQEIIALSGDITALDWVGRPSEFNSCLPAEISSYKAPPYTYPSLSTEELDRSVSLLRDTGAVQLASKLYSELESLHAPRFAQRRLHLPCIAFRVTELVRKSHQGQDTCVVYEVKAGGLRDLLITTEEDLLSARPTEFLLIPVGS
ncbi:hypothetical protein BDR07DRAFT_1611901 [Suillus spraguei]|nr:hypothetical protein BDR07DRAFT_1611901 [Suillus spraguei]